MVARGGRIVEPARPPHGRYPRPADAAPRPDAKAIVWEHNTHVGDARYTTWRTGDVQRRPVGAPGARRRRGRCWSASGPTGDGRGGGSWDAPMEVMPVPPARAGSWEHALHAWRRRTGSCSSSPPVDAGDALAVPRGHRAIGVVYHPGVRNGGTTSRPSCRCGTTRSSTWTKPRRSTRCTSNREAAHPSSIPGACDAAQVMRRRQLCSPLHSPEA